MNKSQKGFLLISSYLVLSSLMTLTLALWMRGVGLLNQSEAVVYQMEAFHLAESGLDTAIAALENDLSYPGVADVTHVKNGRLIGNYSVTVETPSLSNPYRKRVTATGQTPDLDGNGRGQATRTIVCWVDLVPRKTFNFAVFAKQSITMSGSQSVTVDSYDSAMGPYNTASAKSNADVMTNSIASAAITLTGNVTIKGDAQVETGGDPSTGISVGSNSSITGTTGSAVSNKDYESPLVPKSAVPMGNVVLDANKKLVLSGGVYVFDSINMTGKSTLEFTGPATVYLTGNSYIAGNGVMTAESYPKNLMIHVVGNKTLEYAGNGGLYAGIYAPDAHVDVSGKGSVFGGVVANTFHQHGGGHFHYDEDLKRQDTSAKLRAEIVSWQEMNKFLG